MTTKCERCDEIVNGSRLCFKCWTELLDEDESSLRLAKYYPNSPADAAWAYKNWVLCNSCWPFDCGCL